MFFPVLILAAVLGCATRAFGAHPPAGSIFVRFGSHTLTAEVAATEDSREHGLMFRRELAKDDGMIFVFDEPQESSFWMKNTPRPLSIAYLDSNKKILNVDQMAAFDDRNFHKSKGLALSAVAQPTFRLGDAAAPVSYDARLSVDPREAAFTGETRRI